MSKKVSVIIPCYNVEKYLNDCFKSLDNQTYQNLEIIFVNDGSIDDSLLKIQEYCNKNTNAKVITKQNGGVSSAKNVGIDNATGDYIYFYDPDDIINFQLIEHLVNIIESNEADFAITYCKRIKEKENLIKLSTRKEKCKKEKIIFNQDIFILLVNDYNIFTSVWNKLYKASIINTNHLRFNDNCLYGEDTPFNYNYIKFVNKTVVSSRVLYYYVQGKNSLVHQDFKEKRLSVFPEYNEILENENNVFTPYIHLMRLYNAIECLHFIKKSDYQNKNVINSVIKYVETDLKYVKKCKKVKLHRRLLMPLVPVTAKILLRHRLKNGQEGEVTESLK